MPLFIIATPLGNLGDMSQRAIETLKHAPLIAAEDTRSVRRLLSAFNLGMEGKQIVSYGEHNEQGMAARLIEKLSAGTDIAIVSEGGTPLISDPGYRLVRGAIDAGAEVVSIPGPCAAITALAASGLPVHAFLFRGFLPKKEGARRRILESLKDREETLIFYESPQRVPKVLPEFVEIFGAQRPACLAREMTKIHETIWRFPLGELAQKVESQPLKGECTLLVSGVTRSAGPDSEDEN